MGSVATLRSALPELLRCLQIIEQIDGAAGELHSITFSGDGYASISLKGSHTAAKACGFTQRSDGLTHYDGPKREDRVHVYLIVPEGAKPQTNAADAAAILDMVQER